MRAPDVSVIIPSFNRADLIGKAVRSAIEQRGCTVEVIVLDDGSSDGTREVLNEAFPGMVHDESAQNLQEVALPSVPIPPGYTDEVFPRIRYRWQSNGGMSAANNTGLAMSVGEFVKFLDSDDELISDSLHHELAAARKLGIDALCTGFEERTYVAGAERREMRKKASPPRIDRGIDDMLTGQAPWTAAALYRRAIVGNLRWPLHIRFGNDWAWAWTVCLTGAKFASLPIESAVYNHHDAGQMTTETGGFEKSVTARQQILELVHQSLRDQGLLTEERRQALAQYFYKDAFTLYERDPQQLKSLCKRCNQLVPGFKPIVYNPRMQPFVTLLGPFRGVALYARLKRIVRSNTLTLELTKWLLRKVRRDYAVGG